MSTTKISIQLFRSGKMPDTDIMLGERLIRQLRIPTEQPIKLALGSFKQEIRVISGKKSTVLRISPSLSNSFGLLPGAVLTMRFNAAERTLRLGPVIGVMISRYLPEDPGKPFGSISSFCMEMVNACNKLGAYVYFFTPDMITSNLSLMEAVVYDNGWRKSLVPVPDVVNNRLPTRKLENSPSVQHFMKEVKSKWNTHIFNERFLDKTEVFEALGTDERLNKYLPESYELKSFTTLKKMCTAYPVVFLKPIRGSQGKGIIRISRQENGIFHTLTTSLEGVKKNSYTSLAKLYSSLSGKMAANRYQIQQGLDLVRVQKRNVDFRALVHKNKKGKWSITSIVARIAGGNHYVSNLARGGTLSSVKDALAMSSIPPSSKQTAEKRMELAALNIARGIEESIPSHFGELGIDLAVDVTGRIWLIEINSKPSKSDDAPLSVFKVRPSAIRLVQYSQYLTGY
ncbi:YheC/YheD family endospore coat-associated protein [Paenibacillus dakarensis]|uniref:YheC/YheD family endospore coat-associated protein n=1 Tax=Paenibacillus dakarensis TaxID=1527293 RepID=UPI0006D5A70F|nr:YheC/YheD family protein [Paenibacillus dakarensis]